MTFPGLLIFWPPKIPTSTPPLGWGGQFFLGRNHPQICRDLCILNPFSDLFFAFKVTISRHFAGYASVALETIWRHEPRDLIFLGPPMTLLCLSRYSNWLLIWVLGNLKWNQGSKHSMAGLDLEKYVGYTDIRKGRKTDRKVDLCPCKLYC